MRPSEVRARVLADHERFRTDLEILESLAVEAAAPRPDADRVELLRIGTETFLGRLSEHMRWEEAYLAPALREADAWGVQRVERLIEDHREQRELLSLILSRVQDVNRPDKIVAHDVESLVRLMREDMREEESELLDERVLRDDIVGIDVEAG